MLSNSPIRSILTGPDGRPWRPRLDRPPAARPRRRRTERGSGGDGMGGRSGGQPAPLSSALSFAASRRAPPRHPDAEPQRAGPPSGGNVPAPPSAIGIGPVARSATAGRPPRPGRRRSSGVGPRKRSVRWSPSSRTQRTSRAPAGNAIGPNPRPRWTADGRGGVLGEWHRDEQSPARHAGVRVAGSRRGLKDPGSALRAAPSPSRARARPRAAMPRSSRRTSRAAS